MAFNQNYMVIFCWFFFFFSPERLPLFTLFEMDVEFGTEAYLNIKHNYFQFSIFKKGKTELYSKVSQGYGKYFNDIGWDKKLSLKALKELFCYIPGDANSPHYQCCRKLPETPMFYGICWRILHYFHSKASVRHNIFKSNKNVGVCHVWGWKPGYDVLIANPTGTDPIASVKPKNFRYPKQL